jgi:hypothetical protein
LDLLDKFTLRDKVVIKLHNVGSYFVSKPVLPFGVSFMICAKDCKFIRGAVISVLEGADEVVIVDGSDGFETYELIADLVGGKVRYYRDNSPTKGRAHYRHVHQLNFGVDNCRFRWVYKFDGDMVLDGVGWNVWRNRLESLDDRFFYEVDLPCINPSKRLKFGGFEGRLFTQHPSLRYKWVPDRDSIVYPVWVRLLRWDERFVLHLDPK